MSIPILQVQLDVIAQELSYMGTSKPIPENYWKDTLSLLLYPDWDSEKDKLITFSYYSDSNTYIAARRKYVRNFKTNKDEYLFDLIFNCSGLHTDRVFENLTGLKPKIKIIPFRGEYFKFKNNFKNLVNHLIYPVPDPKFPFLGVHFTRMINGDREVGPNSVLAFKREGYKNTDISLHDLYDSLTYSGLIKFVLNNFSFSLNEFTTSLSKNLFIKKAKKMIPDVKSSMFEKGISGVRAQAVQKTGNLLMDFEIVKHKNQIHVLNAPSPGATASLSIADHILKYI